MGYTLTAQRVLRIEVRSLRITDTVKLFASDRPECGAKPVGSQEKASTVRKHSAKGFFPRDLRGQKALVRNLNGTVSAELWLIKCLNGCIACEQAARCNGEAHRRRRPRGRRIGCISADMPEEEAVKTFNSVSYSCN
jgi:hypothetical protein